jgi:hypothetical protein
MPFDPVRLHKTMPHTSPDKLAALSLETLQACHHFLTEQQAVLYNPKDLPIVTERLQLLRGEIELRRMDARSDQQHGQVIGLGRKTLFLGEGRWDCWGDCDNCAFAIRNAAFQASALHSTPSVANLLAAIGTKPRALTNSHVSRIAVSYTDNLT